MIQVVLKKIKYSNNEYFDSFYICHTNLARAKLVAKTLVKTWKQAQIISKANGDEFLAVLQPTAFLGNPQTKHLNMDNSLYIARKKQIEIVYPLIIKEALENNINFIYLSQALDGDKYYFINPVHVSPNAHEIS